jgi:hypothetical protein
MNIDDSDYRISKTTTHLLGRFAELIDSDKRVIFPAICKSVVLINNQGLFDFGCDTDPEIFQLLAQDPRSGELSSKSALNTYRTHSNVCMKIIDQYEILIGDHNDNYVTEIERTLARSRLGILSPDVADQIIQSARDKQLPKVKFNREQKKYRFLEIARLVHSHFKVQAQKGILRGTTPAFNAWNELQNSQEGRETSEFLERLPALATPILDN